MAQHINDKVKIKANQIELTTHLIAVAQETLCGSQEDWDLLKAECNKHAPEYNVTPEQLMDNIFNIMGIGG